MEINNSLVLSSLSSSTITNESTSATVKETQTENRQTDTLSISNIGEMAKNIDDLFEQMDQIYMSKLTDQQKSDIKDYYRQVDELFEEEQLTLAGEKKLEALFTNIDNIYQLSEQKFTAQDWQSLETLDQKAEQLIAVEDDLFSQLDEELSNIEERQYDLIASQLSNKETNQLANYHDQIERLFNATNVLSDNKNQKLTELFSKIESIWHSGFEKLSKEQKQTYNKFEDKLTYLLEKYDQEQAK